MAKTDQREHDVHTSSGTNQSREGQNGFRLLLATLRSNARLYVVIFGVCLGAFVGYIMFTPKWYRAETTIILADSKAAASSGSLESVAALTGLPLGSTAGQEPLAILKSRSLLRGFIEERQLLPVLFANKWDDERKKWKSGDPADQPDIRDAVKIFDEKLRTVVDDRKAGLITLRVIWTDPAIAASWAEGLVRAVNERTRAEALVECERNVSYLQGELSRAEVLPVQQAIGRVLESQLQKLALARAKSDFSFKFVDVPVPPKRAYWPNARLLIIPFLVISAFLSGIAVLATKLGARRLYCIIRSAVGNSTEYIE